jgi:hypothetical protein
MKIIAFYLPQFHVIQENEKWWGKDFTEWVNVKRAKPLFDGHMQPRVPLNKNYYNLLDDQAKIWQVKIAKEHGIYGFCYYHYWFGGKLLLEKPMEQMLENKDIDMPFCICWANEPWTKAWVGKKEVLIPQTYGDINEWRTHFSYLLPFLKDKRYIRANDEKPIIVFYRPEVIGCLVEMLKCWQDEAVKAGLPGIVFAFQSNGPDIDKSLKYIRDAFDFDIEFQPIYAFHDMNANRLRAIKAIRRWLANIIEKRFGIDLLKYGDGSLNKTNKFSYSEIWDKVLQRDPIDEKCIPGAFCGWDNSPRHGENGKIYIGDEPNMLKKYMIQQISRAKDVYKKDLLFMYAWNEWAEGGYLEPDERYGYGYLEAIKEALVVNNEFPHYKDENRV